MRIDVLDADTLARVGWVKVWHSLYWDSPYYSEGSFTLEVRPTAENLQLLQEGRWLVRSDENPRIPMRICSRTNQNEDANLVVSGYPATWLLTKRVSAVSIKNQNAEAAMRSLVSAAKPWPRLELGTEYGFDTVFAKQTSGGTVFDYCQTIGQACDLGFRIVLDGKGSSKRLLFECFRPTFDPNRRYSPQWGNLLNAGVELCRHRLRQRRSCAGRRRRQQPRHRLGGGCKRHRLRPARNVHRRPGRAAGGRRDQHKPELSGKAG